MMDWVSLRPTKDILICYDFDHFLSKIEADFLSNIVTM